MPRSRQTCFVLVSVLLLLLVTGCGPSRAEVMEKLVSKEENKLHMHLFSDSQDWPAEVNEIYNNEPVLLEHIKQVSVHYEENKLKWLKALGLEEKRPMIVIVDGKQLVYHTSDPGKLKEFADILAASPNQ
ncbi:hypothetical protein [Paenibacillus piscarius]|uniref:hypothetical protein n=1 Tax=Paenibacillus piscarius TaxID=1089681 RepID=UPI001EE97D97|nr:hypothetical protein [Paenibacillus piscarius]